MSGREAERLAEKLCSRNASSSSSGSSSSGSSSSGSSSSGGSSSGTAGSSGPLSLAQLQAKWEGLRRVLPDTDVAAMVSTEPALLSATAGDLVGALVALVEAFPSHNVQAIAEGRPGLLLMPAQELRQRCERVVSKLLQLHPSRDREVVSEVIESNPELLIRMDYYLDAMLLDDLPVELQNMFIPPGDMGIGWLYRHYAKGDGSKGDGSG